MKLNVNDHTLKLDNTPWRLIKPQDVDNERCCCGYGFISTIEGHTNGAIRMAEATNTALALLNYEGHDNHQGRKE